MKFRFAGIHRQTEFSPNHIESDWLIIQSTAENLRRLGADVVIYEEGELGACDMGEDLVFSMAQGPRGIAILDKISRERDILIINSPQSVVNCYRVNMVTRLQQGGVPFPHSVVLPTANGNPEAAEKFHDGKIWVKRGDVHAVHQEDVVLTYNRGEALMMLHEFAQRGIEHAVFQEHLDGDTVKFYALRGSDFFHWYYLNGTHHAPFSVPELRRLASLAARALGLVVYGGDAIIQTDGSIQIIDINDWPSFGPVRETAGQEIARTLYKKAEEFYHGKQQG